MAVLDSLFHFGIARTVVLRFLSFVLALAAIHAQASAADVNVAVAANFTAPMRTIAQAFEQETGHKAVLSFGSTGNFHAQVRNGAPFHVLLAADDETPLKLEQEGLGVAGSRFTYATGRLVLWSRQAGLVDDKGDVLRSGRFQRIAMANPKLAPYGAAALETMTKLGVLDALRPRIVQGENIAQAYQFVATENAQLGFVALSQVAVDGRIAQGSGWIVPAALHAPIRQDAVLLQTGRDNPAAAALLSFLRGERARAVMRAFGYEV
ncbi:MAG: molybdate ABC transporter substrate-binding protein [Comamonadaceae bacterium]|nr:MAG: molybdate ABC transporter substrate-binding protein [Comamonadaceae bacterium]